MFDLDSWGEVFSTIKKNKLRTFLTGFSISWGIFMFCILLSAGNGLKNGMTSNFESRSTNNVKIWGRYTSMSYKGFPRDRYIKLDERDLLLIREQIPEAVSISGIISTSLSVSYNSYHADCSFSGVTPDYMNIDGVKIKDGQGRFLNEMDMKNYRKVAVINPRMQEVLFQKDNPLGKQFIAGGLRYTVIGVFEENSWGDRERAYIPFSTASLLYSHGWGLDNIAFTISGLETKKENEVFEERFRNKLSNLHIFDPKDTRSISVWNQLTNYLQTIGIFNGLSLFIWVIGIGTLIAGVISVSNIMLITVRERTHEFGIRKALGAKPSSILGTILKESIFITSVFGYIGMFLGVGLGEMVNSALNNAESSPLQYIFHNPTIDVGVAVGAMCILIISGAVAGYFPALKAVSILPVKAMKEK
ncbi:MAG: ABC transporter permease [Bacteroidales bacterium]|jgi:putative ABC transport system permease protein|nr:ABC transporter permease [Bacteroidales bacterium]